MTGNQQFVGVWYEVLPSTDFVFLSFVPAVTVQQKPKTKDSYEPP